MRMKATVLLEQEPSSNTTALTMNQEDVQACLDAKLIEYLGTTTDHTSIVYRLTYEGRILLGDLHRRGND